jgi:hypothetical protein
MMVTDCYTDKEHAIFKAGLLKVDEACKARFGTTFMESTPAQRTDLANALETEQRAQHASNPNETAHYFRMMKDLTLLGFFSSEIGCTKAVRYIEVPGSYNGNAPYTKGEKAWF